MKQYRVPRKITAINVVAGATSQPIDLPRSYDYESIFLRLSGNLQVTVAATAVRAEAPLQLVPRIVVMSDGKNVLFNAPMWGASLARIDRPLNNSGARVTTPPSGTAIATYAVEAIGVIDFATVDGMRPKDTNFRTSALSLFQLIATFGQPGDPFVGGTVNFSGVPTLEVFTQEMIELPDVDPTTGKATFTQPIMLRKVSFLQQALLASNPQNETRLPAGNLLRSVLARTEGAVTAGEPSTAIINNAILQSGLDVMREAFAVPPPATGVRAWTCATTSPARRSARRTTPTSARCQRAITCSIPAAMAKRRRASPRSGISPARSSRSSSRM